MDTLDRAALIDLLDQDPNVAVSLFMPGHADAGAQARQDPIRFRNLLDSAQEQLLALDIRATAVDELLAPARERLDAPEFWQENGAHSLAVFIAPDFFRHFRVPVLLDEKVAVDTSFRVKPLIPALSHARHYYVLALSENHNRLVLVQDRRAAVVEMPGAPSNLNESMKLEDRENSMQMHSTGSPQSGNASAMVHGGGSWHDYEKAQQGHYLGEIDAVLVTMLAAQPAPLLLAGVEALVAAYRNSSDYAQVVPGDYLQGNHDDTSPQQFAELSWPIIDRLYNQGGVKLERMVALAGTPQGATDPATVVQAAAAGRVDTLFVDVNAELYGSFDPNTQSAELHSARSDGSVDLAELACAFALRSADELVALPRELIPGGTPLAALLRW